MMLVLNVSILFFYLKLYRNLHQIIQKTIQTISWSYRNQFFTIGRAPGDSQGKISGSSAIRVHPMQVHGSGVRRIEVRLRHVFVEVVQTAGIHIPFLFIIQPTHFHSIIFLQFIFRYLTIAKCIVFLYVFICSMWIVDTNEN